MRLLITGGGTGGHVYPLLAVLQSLVASRELDPSSEVRYLGRPGGIEERLAAQAGIPFVPLLVAGLRTLAPWALARNLLLMRNAAAESRRVVNEFRPEVVLATGGYVSAPAIWSAARAGVPVVIYLPDLEPGLAIQTMSRLASRVAVSFDQVQRFFPAGKTVVTGYPVRVEFYEADKPGARSHFRIDPRARVVTIFGGSQGSHSINRSVSDALVEMLDLAHVIHISGRQDLDFMQERRLALSGEQNARYHLYGYMDREMPEALAAADLVIARAGAATLGEFPAVGVPAILVPYPFAGKHQEKNAQYLVSCGAAVKVEDSQLGKQLLPMVQSLLLDTTRLAQMGAAARSLARPTAASAIADLVAKAASKS